MQIPDYLDQLEADGPALAAAAERAGWDAPVPALHWTVRDLVTHVGGVHRWAADVVRHARTDLDTEAGAAVGTGPADNDLLEWFVQGHADLVATLRQAPADLHCTTFLPAPSPLAFWARRQAHETAVHRADAQGAAGETASFDPDFAHDGIAEILRGFAARRRKPIEPPAIVALNSTDGPSWQVSLGPDGVLSAEGDDTDGDLVVTGTSSELYLWLWNRPSGARVSGPDAVARQWAESVRVRWS